MAADESDLPTFGPEEEAFIREEIERELAPFVGLAPPALLATMRAVAEEALRTHALPVAYRRQLFADERRRGKAPERSGEVLIDGDAYAFDSKAGGQKEGA